LGRGSAGKVEAQVTDFVRSTKTQAHLQSRKKKNRKTCNSVGGRYKAEQSVFFMFVWVGWQGERER
jgi:hypothetical protein